MSCLVEEEVAQISADVAGRGRRCVRCIRPDGEPSDTPLDASRGRHFSLPGGDDAAKHLFRREV